MNRFSIISVVNYVFHLIQYLVTDSFSKYGILPWLKGVAEPFISKFFKLSIEIRYLHITFKVNVCSFPANRGPYLPNCKKKAVLLCLSEEFTNKLPKILVAQFSNESTTSSDPSTANDITDAAE